MDDELIKSALEYHAKPRPGKIEIAATKPLANQRDLALAYSPGVAAPCELIAEDPAYAAQFTARANLVAVVINGSAVLGLGNIGPLAAKPVMEGKGVLFKKFSGIDVFDIEINESDPDRLVDIIASLEPTFGGINLEDIKSPECFYIERELRKRVNIPVFHDDQHGTAIITAAAIKNSLRIVNKDIGDVRLVTSGAGAAAIACVKLLESIGLKRENVTLVDRSGVVYKGRDGDRMDAHKADYAGDTAARTLAEAIRGADIFLGLSAPGVLTGDMVKGMAERPIILALANPTLEIMPEEARAARDDAIIATGRSDYPNQVNNVLCFPYMFRGALDVGATTINEAMKIACVNALADLTLQEASEVVLAAYAGEELKFGPEYVIPKPFDPRLVSMLAPAVAKAAMDSGVATRPLADLEAYRQEMTKQVLVLRKGTFFICDTHVNDAPTAEIIAEMTLMTLMTVERVKRFGIIPKVALLAASNFGTRNSDTSQRMRDALPLIQQADPGLEIDGEMRADAALVPAIREQILHDSDLQGQANVLIMPSVDAANIAMNLLTVLGEGVAVGPVTLGLNRPAHILTPSATVRRVINMSTLAVVDAQLEKDQAEIEKVLA